VKNINQIAEELDIIVGIVKAQQKVLSRIKTESDVAAETLGSTIQKLEFFHSDMEEYKRSCARLSKLVYSISPFPPRRILLTERPRPHSMWKCRWSTTERR
jgi:hypothetical protein